MQKQDMAKWVSSMKKGILLSHFQQNFRVKVHQTGQEWIPTMPTERKKITHQSISCKMHPKNK